MKLKHWLMRNRFINIKIQFMSHVWSCFRMLGSSKKSHFVAFLHTLFQLKFCLIFRWDKINTSWLVMVRITQLWESTSGLSNSSSRSKQISSVEWSHPDNCGWKKRLRRGFVCFGKPMICRPLQCSKHTKNTHPPPPPQKKLYALDRAELPKPHNIPSNNSMFNQMYTRWKIKHLTFLSK